MEAVIKSAASAASPTPKKSSKNYENRSFLQGILQKGKEHAQKNLGLDRDAVYNVHDCLQIVSTNMLLYMETLGQQSFYQY